MDGSLILVQTIGQNLFQDDELVLAEATRVRRYGQETHQDKRRRINAEIRPHIQRSKTPLSGLMQRILTYLYNRARDKGKKA